MADREEGFDIELVDRVDFHPRGSLSTGLAGNRISNVVTSRRCSASAGSYACRSHHVDHTGSEAEQQKHDETERRRRQQTVEPPANRRPDDNARNQLRGKPETQRHRRCSGSPVSAFSSGLISPEFPAVPNFGQPLIQTSEPCGKRSFVGRRLIAIPTCVVVLVFGHAQDSKRCQRLMEITPVTLESRADHTYRVYSSQD